MATPHVCPKCKGEKVSECHPCKGQGIVWDRLGESEQQSLAEALGRLIQKIAQPPIPQPNPFQIPPYGIIPTTDPDPCPSKWIYPIQVEPAKLGEMTISWRDPQIQVSSGSIQMSEPSLYRTVHHILSTYRPETRYCQ